MRQVFLVAGPPCAGKSTYVASHARPGDLVLDQDALGRTRYDQLIRRVATMTDGTAWVIRSAPGQRARDAFARRVGATDTVLLLASRAELNARAALRADARRARAAIGSWFRAELTRPY